MQLSAITPGDTIWTVTDRFSSDKTVYEVTVRSKTEAESSENHTVKVEILSGPSALGAFFVHPDDCYVTVAQAVDALEDEFDVAATNRGLAIAALRSQHGL